MALKTKWSLEEALALVRELEETVSVFGWHVGLTGGVLKRGYSEKDVDIIAYPHKRGLFPKFDIDNLYTGLRLLGFQRTHSRKRVKRGWALAGSKDRKWVEIWARKGRRMDLMVMS